MDDTDPTTTNPQFYRTLWENEEVRILEYQDMPGEETSPHHHPNSVMVTLTGFDRRLTSGTESRDVTLPAGIAVWLPAQSHSGQNVGNSPTHTILVELKKSAVSDSPAPLGPVV